MRWLRTYANQMKKDLLSLKAGLSCPVKHVSFDAASRLWLVVFTARMLTALGVPVDTLFDWSLLVVSNRSFNERLVLWPECLGVAC